MPPLNVHHSYTADVLSTDSAKFLLEIDIILVCNNKDQETRGASNTSGASAVANKQSIFLCVFVSMYINYCVA